jgi:hypothetical protein
VLYPPGARLLVGTSGYSYPDWEGTLYPPGTPREAYLGVYAACFPVVELNFSYYTQPAARTLERMLQATPEGFLFSIKAHRSLTHEPGEDLAAEVRRFREGIAPLSQSGRLAAVLFQFPFSFHYTPTSRRHLAGLCEAFGELPALCEHLHLPVQSGANRVLARMNRGYTREHYLEKVASLKGSCPGIALSTDLIVGFPGETEADFLQTLDLMGEAGFDQAFSFKYSPRPQTRATTFPDQVPEDVKAERLARLQAVQDELTQKAHARLVGQEQEVLVEGRSKRSPQDLCGRLRTNQVVNFTGPRELVGHLARVAIIEAHPHSLKGRWVEGSPPRNRAAERLRTSPREVSCSER